MDDNTGKSQIANPKLQTNSNVQASNSRVGSQGDQSQIAQSAQSVSDLDQPIAPPLSKKEKEAIGSLYKEGEPGVIEKKEFKIPKEVSEVVKEVKKEEEIRLPQPIKDEYGQILMEAARPSKPKIVLPLDDQGMKTGIKKKASDSIKWLATLCLRLIKMFPRRIVYKTKNQK